MIISKNKFKKGLNHIAKDFSSTRNYNWGEFEFFEKTLFKDSEVLDFGCGNGRVTPFFLQHQAKVVCFDVSEELLKIAQEKYQDYKNEKKEIAEIDEKDVINSHKRVEFTLGYPGEILPYSHEKFDAIWAIASFHHIFTAKDRQMVMEEFHRTIKNDGKLVMTVWNLKQEKFKKQRRKAFIKSFIIPHWKKNDLIIPFGQEKIPRYYYSFDKKELHKSLEKNFFQIEEIFYSKGNQIIENAKKAHNLCVIAKKISRIKICEIPFDIITKKTALEKMHQLANRGKNEMIFTPNPEICLEASKNEKFKNILNQATLSFADGTGIIWAYKNKSKNIFSAFLSLIRFFFSRKKIGNFERIQGSEMFKKFCLSTDKKVFLLGGGENVAKKCGEFFENENKNFLLAGYDEGSSKEFDDKRICEKINKSQAEVLFVAFGAPAQELWIARNIKNLNNIHFAMGVGGSFDFIAGKQKRAPKLFVNLGLEWLWRLFLQPERIKRIWSATYKFVKLNLK